MKITRLFNKKENRWQYKARFQINKIEFTPVADTKSELNDLIDEIRVEQRRIKKKLTVLPPPSPRFADLLEKHSKRIPKEHQRVLFNRVSRLLLDLLPDEIKISELKKAHFQKYIDFRLSQTSQLTGNPVLSETVDKELYAISSALRDAPLYFAELENYQKPIIPKAAKGKKRKRERLVNRENELKILLEHLRQPKQNTQTKETELHRQRLADDLEFRAETGLRRKEVVKLKKNQYFPDENCLRDVIRWKTGTVTKFFPLTRLAKAIIENRLKFNQDSDFIFTENGEPYHSDYRTLKTVCKKLNIPYGRFAENGFIAHDLRHNFGTDIIQHSDIETARELLGHSNVQQTIDYLHTNEARMREAIRRKEGIDLKTEIVQIYKAVRRKKMKAKIFVEKVQKLAKIAA